jgi:hypothetical protein
LRFATIAITRSPSTPLPLVVQDDTVIGNAEECRKGLTGQASLCRRMSGERLFGLARAEGRF